MGRCRQAAKVSFDPIHDGAERLLGHQLFHDRLVERIARSRCAGEPGPLGQLAEDLEPLDRIDAEVGFEVEVGTEHVERIAGALTDQSGQQRHHVRDLGGRPRARIPGLRRRLGDGNGRLRRRCRGHDLVRRRHLCRWRELGRWRRLGQLRSKRLRLRRLSRFDGPSQITEEDLTLRIDQLAHRVQISQHRRISLGGDSHARGHTGGLARGHARGHGG